MSDTGPKPAAIVLNFRTPEQTVSCLDSLVDQGIQHIVLVDNSEDQGVSLNAMRTDLERLRSDLIQLDTLSDGRNLGFSAGVNRALAHIARTNPADVLLINSDARLMPGCMDALLTSLHDGADLTAPMLVDSADIIHQPVSYYQKHTGLLSSRPLPGSVAFLTGACILISQTLASANLLDEEFFFYGEDVMLGATLKSRGMTHAVTENGQTMHSGGGSARNGSPFYEYHINRGHCLLAIKLACTPMQRAINLAGRLVYLPARAVLRSLRNGNMIPVISLWQAVRDVASGRLQTMTPPASASRQR